MTDNQRGVWALLFRFICVSFRLVSVYSGTILVHSVSFRCYSASFRHIPVYSVPFLCLVTPRGAYSSSESVIIILYPVSQSRILYYCFIKNSRINKLNSSTEASISARTILVQNGFCRPFFLTAAKMFSARFIAEAFLDHIR